MRGSRRVDEDVATWPNDEVARSAERVLRCEAAVIDAVAEVLRERGRREPNLPLLGSADRARWAGDERHCSAEPRLARVRLVSHERQLPRRPLERCRCDLPAGVAIDAAGIDEPWSVRVLGEP